MSNALSIYLSLMSFQIKWLSVANDTLLSYDPELSSDLVSPRGFEEERTLSCIANVASLLEMSTERRFGNFASRQRCAEWSAEGEDAVLGFVFFFRQSQKSLTHVEDISGVSAC